MTITPHFSHPFRVTGSKVATVEQDSVEEVRTCVLAILSTRLGSRMEAPAFGIPDEVFALLPANPSVDEVVAVVEEWEPRARVLGRATVAELVKSVTIEMESA